MIADRGLHIPKFNQEWKHSLTVIKIIIMIKNKKREKNLFTSGVTFFVRCLRHRLRLSRALGCTAARRISSLQQIQIHLRSLDVLGSSCSASYRSVTEQIHSAQPPAPPRP